MSINREQKDIINKKKERTPGEILASYTPDIPEGNAAKVTRTIMRLLTSKCPVRFHYDFDKREMRGRQVLILAQHTSRDDPYYVNVGYPYINPNAIMSMHNALIPIMFRLLLKDGVILKSLFEPDIGAVKQLMRLRKKNASFLLFPEGVESADGTTQPLHPATAGLVKKLAMDTVLCTNHGAYLCQPRFDTNKRKGRLDYYFEILLRKEEIENMTEDEIYSLILEKFRYNEFEWNSKKQFSYKGKVPNAHGLDNLLFICPRCKKQYSMHVDGDSLLCECGSKVTIDDRYNLIPNGRDFPFERIDQWNRWQREVITEEVSREDFVLREEVIYRTLNLEDLKKGRYITVGEGRLELDRERLRYTGTKNEEKVELEFDISRVPSSAINPERANQIYYDGEYYQFAIEGDRRHYSRLTMAIEALHEMKDTERRKARKDVLEG